MGAPTITEFPVPTHNRQPLGITAGPDGNVWFVQSVAPGGIGRSNVSGLITEFSSGLSGGALSVTPGPDGNLWFTEPGADKIGRITPSGTIKEFSPANGSEPAGIAAGPDGNLWFTEPGGKAAIGRITTSGTITEFTAGLTQNGQPKYITAGPDGNLWFTEMGNPGRIGRITTSGSVTEFTTGLTQNSQPDGIASGPDGNLWFTEMGNPGRIGRITTSGSVTEFTTGLTQNVGPRGITAGNDGNMYFTEPYNSGKIGEITPSGVITERATPTSFSQPAHITTGPDGNLWFTEAANPGRIAMMTVAPKVAGGMASSVSEQSATLGASVGPNSQATTYRFEYGPTTAYGSQTASSSAGSGASSAPVSSALSGLSPATLYHFRALATNATGTTFGADQTFTTTTPPTATSQPAGSVGLTSATLTGSINPKGQATTYHFDWGETAAYGNKSPAVDASVGSDSSKHLLEGALTELTPDHTYHFRIVATNCGGCAEGTTYGADETFTSAALPTATTEAAEAVGLTSATLSGAVNPRGAATTYHFDWGETTAYGSQSPMPDTTVGSDSASHEVTQVLAALNPGATYHFRIVATNCEGCVAGTVYGGDQAFTTIASPSAATGAAEAIGPTSAVLTGAANPRGTAATYHFDWGETGSYGNQAPGADAPVGSDSASHETSQSLAGLTPGTIYHYRLVATNCGGCSAGTAYGADQSFSTVAPPLATTEAPAAVGITTATLAGSVNPRGNPTTYHFDWGETAAYGEQSPGSDEGVGADGVPHELTQGLDGLISDTTYHYRVVASNCAGCMAGTTYGADATVRPSSPPVVLAGVEELPIDRIAPHGVAPPPRPTSHSARVAPPALGRTATVRALTGTVLVQATGSPAPRPLAEAGDIPMGSLVDARRGSLILTTAVDRHGHTQSATLWGGAFVIGQIASQRGMTTFTLPGSHRGACSGRGRTSGRLAAAAATGHKPARSLWATDHGGHYSTRGQNSVATVRGTSWGTVERCDGTLTIVKRGAVSVRSTHSHRTVLVRAGHSYLAKA
jgi:streptogramin lyase/ubiquitin